MQRMFLFLLSCLQLWLHFATGEITLHPVDVTAPLNASVSFTCEGNGGDLVWSVSSIQVTDNSILEQFFPSDIFTIPLRQPTSTEMSMIGVRVFNETTVECLLFSGRSVIGRSNIAHLYLYESPNPPTNPNAVNEGTDVVLTWDAPFAIVGEEISYVVTTISVATGESRTQNVTTTRAVISEPLGERDCSVYEFRVMSRNGFGLSGSEIVTTLNIPTVPNVIRSSEIQLTVSLVSTVSVQITFRAPNPCQAYMVTSYNISFVDQSDSSASFSHTGTQSFEEITFIVDDGNTPLQRNRFYQVTVEAINAAGGTFSEPVPLYTTGLQSSSVMIFEVNDTASVTCNFALGSDALGCEVSFYTSSMSDSMELLFAQNITREPSSINTLIKNIPLMGQLEGRTATVQVAELQASGRVSSIVVSPQVTNIPAPPTSPPDVTDTTVVNMVTMTTTSSKTDGTTATESGPRNTGAPLLGGHLYTVIGVGASVIVVFLLLIIIVILVLCSINRRKRMRQGAAVLARMSSLKDNNAYGTNTLPVSLTNPSQYPNGITRNNTYYSRTFDENLGAGITNDAPPPLYETIATKKDLGASNGATSSVAPNPVYGSSEIKSPMVVNPVYAETQGGQVSQQVSTGEKQNKDFEVSEMNPIYSGLVASSSNESTPVRKNYEGAVPVSPLHDTGPQYGNTVIHSGPGIPASAAMDLIKATEQGTPLRKAAGEPSSPATGNLVSPIYEEVKNPKSRTVSGSGHERGVVPVGGDFPMRSLSHTDGGDRNGAAGFPLKRNASYGMLVGSDASAPTSPDHPGTPKIPPKNNGSVGVVYQQDGGTSVVESPPPIPAKTGSFSSSNPSSPSLKSEHHPSVPTSP